MRFLPATALTSCLLTSIAFGQQFVEQPAALPGPIVWSECVVPFDANADGRLDLLFVNANGWRKPGDLGAPSKDPLPPTLLINLRTEKGVPCFEDRTADHFPPSFKIHGKSAAVGDFNADGHPDIAFAVAFGGQQRLFLKNATTGAYDDATDRMPKLVLNSNTVTCGDLDDDGDLDLVFGDAGPNSDKSPGGKARLLLNDGKGRFRDASERLDAIEKIGTQNVKAVDLDGDLDLDIVVDGKSEITQLYLNDGAAHFTRDLTTIPKCEKGGKTYEIEWGDLDNDGDLDGVYMNFSGRKPRENSRRKRMYKNVAIKNMLAETGKLAFKVELEAFKGKNLEDENDFALLDADNDGDLDLLVAVLSRYEEKLFVNQGAFAPGFLAQREGAMTKFIDGTLDMTVADLDGDHRYDVICSQGENKRTEDFRNRFYKNTGPADTRPPTIGRVTQPPKSLSAVDVAAGKFVVRTWVQDATSDDGLTFVSATLEWKMKLGGLSASGEIPMTHVGGGIHRAVLRPLAGTKLAGASVIYHVAAKDPAGNEAGSKPVSFKIKK